MGFKNSRVWDIFWPRNVRASKKAGWFKYFESVGITNPDTIGTMLVLVGIIDIALAVLVLIRPVRAALLWMAIWGLWTAMIRWPVGSDPIWDFVERWANWGAPLALLFAYWLAQKIKGLVQQVKLGVQFFKIILVHIV